MNTLTSKDLDEKKEFWTLTTSLTNICAGSSSVNYGKTFSKIIKHLNEFGTQLRIKNHRLKEYNIISDCLSKCQLISEPFYCARICESLLSNSIAYSWPPLDDNTTSEKENGNIIPSSLEKAITFINDNRHLNYRLKIVNPDFILIFIDVILSYKYSDDPEKSNVEESVIIYLLKCLKFIVDIYDENSEILAINDVAMYILTKAKTVLLQPSSGKSKMKQSLLLLILEKINKFSITTKEFRKYLIFMKSASCPLNIFQTLANISSAYKNLPLSYCKFSSLRSILKTPVEAMTNIRWPPKQGYTISIWINVHYFKPIITLMNITSNSSKNEMSIKLQLENGVITLCFNYHSSEYKKELLRLEENTWHHIVISHSPQKNINGNLLAYLDGIKQCQHEMIYPPTSLSKYLEISYGSHIQSHDNQASYTWYLGNVILFSSALNLEQIFNVFLLGPNFIGRFNSIDNQKYQKMNVLTPKYVLAYCNRYDFLLNPDITTLQSLSDKIFFYLSSRDATIIQSKADPTFRSPVVSSLVRENVYISKRYRFSDAVYNVGGLSMFLYYMATSSNKEKTKAALKIICNVLQDDPSNEKDLKSIYGYEIIARVLKKVDWTLDEEVFAILFNSIGLHKSKTLNTYSIGTIYNANILKKILLDWKIWTKADKDTQCLIFKSIEDSLISNECSKFNIHYLRISRVKIILMMMLEQNNFPHKLAKYIVKILSCLLHKPWSRQRLSDVNGLLRYLIATHEEIDKSLFQCPYEVEHGNVHYNLIPCGQRPTLGGINPTFTFFDDLSLLDSSYEDNFSENRNLVLSLILDTIESCNESKTTFFSACNDYVLLTLLQTTSDSTLLLLLRLINHYLSIEMYELNFRKKGGYVLLGEILRLFPLKENHLSVLFSILIGKLVEYVDIKKPIKLDESNNSKSTLQLRSHAASTILIVITSCNISVPLKHSMIKILHDLFIHSEQFKSDFSTSYILNLLCEIFVIEFEHKVSIQSEMTNESLEYDDQISIEEDVLGFLKSIIVFGLSKNDISLLQKVLSSIHTLSVPFLYSKMLQKRIIYDTLDFYNGSTFANQDTVELFQKTLTLCINLIIHLDTLKKSNNDNKLIKVSSSSSLPSPTQSPIRLSGSFHNLTNLRNSSSHSSLSSKTFKANFWEILDSFEDYDNDEDGTAQMEKNASKKSNDDSTNENFGDSNDSFSVDSSTDDSLLNDHDTFESYMDLTRSNEFKEIKIDINKEMWPKNTNEISDSKLIAMFFTVFQKYLIYRKSLSSLLRISQTIKYKMVGMRSSESSASVSWNMERLIFHLLTSENKKEGDNIRLILENISELNVSESFLSTTEFILRFFTIIKKITENGGYIDECTLCINKMNIPKYAFKNILENPEEFISLKKITTDVFKFKEKAISKAKKINLYDANVKNHWDSQWIKKIEEIRLFKMEIRNQTKLLASKCSDSFINYQFLILKPLMEFVRSKLDEEKKTRSSWKKLIKRVTHENGAFPIHKSLIRWVLDPTEGPFRMKHRLMPIYAHEHPIIGSDLIETDYSRDPKNAYSLGEDINKIQVLKALENQLDEEELNEDLSSFQDSPSVKERVIKSFLCSKITPFHKRNGEILICERHIYFMDSHKFANHKEELQSYTSVKKDCAWPYEDIKEIHKRKYMLINNSLEIFLITGKTAMLAFECVSERDEVYSMLMKMNLPNFVNYETEKMIEGSLMQLSITQKWQKGMITNFEYLMHLNTLAGRTFNDLTQYPVFPYILADYTSEELDLEKESTFRDLSKPMGAQEFRGNSRLLRFKEKYQALLELNEKPYFYGTHYSNIGSVLHFLIRMEPFSQFFIEFQSGRFDVPDRMFYSVEHSWDLSSSLSSSDVKELIPEFFYLSDFLINSNKFDFGVKQDGERVDDVVLPKWAKNSARLFILKHMEALESDYISANLHNWIDLIFGYKQTGEEAFKALNVFHPYTYEGAVDIKNVKDSIERDAIITQINSYGQTPTQLFKKKHPPRSPKYNAIARCDSIFRSPEKLRFFSVTKCESVGKLYFLSGMPMALTNNQDLLWPNGENFINWNNWDNSLHVVSFKTKNIEYEIKLPHTSLDYITIAKVSKNGRYIIAGLSSGLINVWKKVYSTRYDDTVAPSSYFSDSNYGTEKQSVQTETKYSDYTFVGYLDGHTDSVEVIKISDELSVIATGSIDNTVILWDLNRLKYIRSYPKFEGQIVAIEIFPYTAEVVIADYDPITEKSKLTLCSINAAIIATIECEKITALAITTGKPGISNNVIITGHENGDIKMWSSYDLNFIKNIEYPFRSSVTSLAVNNENNCLISGHISGHIYGHSTNPMNFIK